MQKPLFEPVWCFDCDRKSWFPNTHAFKRNMRRLLIGRCGALSPDTCAVVRRLPASPLLMALAAPPGTETPLPSAADCVAGWRDWFRTLPHHWFGIDTDRPETIDYASRVASRAGVSFALDMYNVCRRPWCAPARLREDGAYDVSANGYTLIAWAEALLRRAWVDNPRSYAEVTMAQFGRVAYA